ncbi:multi-sensor signal transduction histidine kinase [Caballeronia choica]|uniref:Multi-sensor signal transduction histidine kinase n=1 Tax=Caballeronia choica TaxID=326476 RepID=A0A158GXQ3_9BURK|nr:multi-sensor signal transduction histidine kinase [Caballeronia choica]
MDARGKPRARALPLLSGLAALLLAGGAAFARARQRSGETRAQATRNDARMLAIVRTSMEAIITIDEAQRIVIFNPMAQKLFRCAAGDALGAPLSRFIPERFREAHARHVRQFGVTGVSDRQMGRQLVLFGLRADGEEFPIEASISQIDDDNGKLYTVMLRDVTERMKADEALRRSREELRELSANLQNVREEEKSRIARELHDDLGQQLTALKMDLSSVEAALDDASPPIAEIVGRLHSMRALVDRTVASVRRIAADQRPVMLDDLGLLPAVDWLADDFTNRYGVEVERRIDSGEIAFTPHAATALFRIVQEALTNVARHADATRVTLDMHIEAENVILTITDDGRGSPGTNAQRGKSFGLIGMRERARMLGGSVSVRTAGGEGFAVTVTLPLRAVQHEEAPT